MSAYLDRIDARNDALNAIVSLRDRDELLAESVVCDDELDRGISRGWMHGFPHAVKDLAETKGLLTTKGSPLLKDFVPDVDSLHVERIRSAGAIFIERLMSLSSALVHTRSTRCSVQRSIPMTQQKWRVAAVVVPQLRSQPECCRLPMAAISWGHFETRQAGAT